MPSPARTLAPALLAATLAAAPARADEVRAVGWRDDRFAYLYLTTLPGVARPVAELRVVDGDGRVARTALAAEQARGASVAELIARHGDRYRPGRGLPLAIARQRPWRPRGPLGRWCERLACMVATTQVGGGRAPVRFVVAPGPRAATITVRGARKTARSVRAERRTVPADVGMRRVAIPPSAVVAVHESPGGDRWALVAQPRVPDPSLPLPAYVLLIDNPTRAGALAAHR